MIFNLLLSSYYLYSTKMNEHLYRERVAFVTEVVIKRLLIRSMLRIFNVSHIRFIFIENKLQGIILNNYKMFYNFWLL